MLERNNLLYLVAAGCQLSGKEPYTNTNSMLSRATNYRAGKGWTYTLDFPYSLCPQEEPWWNPCVRGHARGQQSHNQGASSRVLNGAAVLSKLDVCHGYHQLELGSASRSIATFNTHIGIFRYKPLNFGVSAASGIFLETIHNVIRQWFPHSGIVRNEPGTIDCHSQEAPRFTHVGWTLCFLNSWYFSQDRSIYQLYWTLVQNKWICQRYM